MRATVERNVAPRVVITFRSKDWSKEFKEMGNMPSDLMPDYSGGLREKLVILSGELSLLFHYLQLLTVSSSFVIYSLHL